MGEPETPETVLTEAARITSHGSDRREDYPSALEEAERMALMVRAITGLPFKAEHWHLVMIAMKLMREGHRHKRDNLVDIAGYARCSEMFWDETDERHEPSPLGLITGDLANQTVKDWEPERSRDGWRARSGIVVDDRVWPSEDLCQAYIEGHRQGWADGQEGAIL